MDRRAKTTSCTIANNNGTRNLGTLLMLSLVAAVLLVLASSQTTCAAPANYDTPRALQQPGQAVSSKLRFRRHAASGQQAAAKQLLEGDEQVLKRQLPDLIAQAHQDKTVERALLKMLINASLRSGLSNMVANSAASSGAGNNWQLDNDNTLTQYSQVGDDFVPIRQARMEQAPNAAALGDFGQLDTSDLSSLRATIAQLNSRLQPLLEQQQQQQQFQPAVQLDKREYIKPCSFNAISCVRRPFQVNK